MVDELKRLPPQYLEMWQDFKPLFETAPGSSHNHQAWEGGYQDHLQETFWLADTYYAALASQRGLPFALTDVKQVLFVHDLEKPFKYGQHSLTELAEQDPDRLKHQLAEQYKLPLDSEHWLAVKYIHGENEDYRGDKRVMTPLAAFAHICDISSARIYPGHPVKN